MVGFLPCHVICAARLLVPRPLCAAVMANHAHGRRCWRHRGATWHVQDSGEIRHCPPLVQAEQLRGLLQLPQLFPALGVCHAELCLPCALVLVGYPRRAAHTPPVVLQSQVRFEPQSAWYECSISGSYCTELALGVPVARPSTTSAPRPHACSSPELLAQPLLPGLGLAVSTAGGLGCTALLGWHLYLVFTGQTTLEFYANQGRARACRQQGQRWVNEYDLGWRQNFKVGWVGFPAGAECRWQSPGTEQGAGGQCLSGRARNASKQAPWGGGVLWGRWDLFQKLGQVLRTLLAAVAPRPAAAAQSIDSSCTAPLQECFGVEGRWWWVAWLLPRAAPPRGSGASFPTIYDVSGAAAVGAPAALGGLAASCVETGGSPFSPKWGSSPPKTCFQLGAAVA